MNILYLELPGNTAAAMAVDVAAAGELWGVDLGTTSKIAGYANGLVIAATEARISALSQHLCDTDGDGVTAYSIREEVAFSSMAEEEAIAYLLGRADA